VDIASATALSPPAPAPAMAPAPVPAPVPALLASTLLSSADRARLFGIHTTSSKAESESEPTTRHRLKTGCKAIDEDVLQGGWTYGRGGVVGIACEEGGVWGGAWGGGSGGGFGGGSGGVGDEVSLSCGMLCGVCCVTGFCGVWCVVCVE